MFLGSAAAQSDMHRTIFRHTLLSSHTSFQSLRQEVREGERGNTICRHTRAEHDLSIFQQVMLQQGVVPTHRSKAFLFLFSICKQQVSQPAQTQQFKQVNRILHRPRECLHATRPSLAHTFLSKTFGSGLLFTFTLFPENEKPKQLSEFGKLTLF